jgi:hypothetical protein
MSVLKRTAQFGIKVEAVEAVEEALVAADYAMNHAETDDTEEISGFERDIERGSLSKLEIIKGQQLGTVTGQIELAGGDAATSPKWHDVMEGLGFAKSQLKMIEVVTLADEEELLTGQTIGDNASLPSATKTGTFVHLEQGTPNKLWYIPLVGVFADTDTVFNYTSPQFSADIDANPVNDSWYFRPQSENGVAISKSVSVERRNGGFRSKIIGSRGTGGLRLALGEPARLRFDFKGPPLQGADGAALTGAPVASVPSVGVAPKSAKAIALRFVVDGTPFTPILTEVDFDFGNTLAPRETIADNDVAGTGHLATRITDRNMRASIDPELDLTNLDLVQLARTSTTFEIIAPVGLAAHDQGLVIAYAPRATAEGNFQRGERDGIETMSNNVMLAGEDDNELYVFHVFA